MNWFIDEIIDFLQENGIRCGREVRICFQLIRAETAKGDIRTILPLEVRAGNLEEAREANGEACKAVAGIRSEKGSYPLIITEDRWRSQRSMMEARLLAHLEIFESVFARNCEVRRIEKAQARAFLSANHSYGYAACKYHYGLINKKDGRLIAVATFSNARKWVKGDRKIRSYEWTRYASLPNLRISGGMGKFLKAFTKEVNPDDIMSYADLEWSEGQVYKALGFVREPVGKSPVSFAIDPVRYERKAIGKDVPDDPSLLYFTNFGSAKYRLKLTSYI